MNQIISKHIYIKSLIYKISVCIFVKSIMFELLERPIFTHHNKKILLVDKLHFNKRKENFSMKERIPTESLNTCFQH